MLNTDNDGQVFWFTLCLVVGITMGSTWIARRMMINDGVGGLYVQELDGRVPNSERAHIQNESSNHIQNESSNLRLIARVASNGSAHRRKKKVVSKRRPLRCNYEQKEIGDKIWSYTS